MIRSVLGLRNYRRKIALVSEAIWARLVWGIFWALKFLLWFSIFNPVSCAQLCAEKRHKVDLRLNASPLCLTLDWLAQLFKQVRSSLWCADEVVSMGCLHADCACVDKCIFRNVLWALARELVKVFKRRLVFNFITDVHQEVYRCLLTNVFHHAFQQGFLKLN